MKNCTECNSVYDETKTNIVYPLEDNTCSECGTLLSKDVIDAIKSRIKTLEQA